MANNIIEQAKRGLEGFTRGGYHTSCHYGKYQEEYFKYFGDPDYETRKYAIAAFTCMLGAWETGALFIFQPVKEWEENKKWSSNPLNQKRFYRFKDYLHALLDHHEQIEKEFPYMFEEIILFLIEIEQNKGISYEEWFPEHNPNVFKRLREEVLIPKKQLAEKRSPHKYLLKEIGIKPFFESDKY
ncbi:hypothetical protein CSE16_08270 [Solibacillus sp. R5-41]|uniref:hypothetical protein n=1 Tax=Solibacillus sp. R5-41 TaxID=2048654 RepID=UPI000C127EDF|nr:hypothetical protein [Solibacillus sp. R5-41]ATP40043.1 hypothetical protein CSE16_08270 [Solibacillus sp. R5-41]